VAASVGRRVNGIAGRGRARVLHDFQLMMPVSTKDPLQEAVNFTGIGC